MQEVCTLSIFHPSVYPKFKDPYEVMYMRKLKLENKEPEPQPRRSSARKVE